MAIRRGTHTENFTVLPNELINDNSMSLEARGMLILLLSKPAGWQISNAGLVAMLSEGQHKSGRELVGRMMREIVEAGYMVRSQERLPDGTLGQTDYEVHSIRYGWEVGQPQSAKPLTGLPPAAKSLQESIDTKKEQIGRKKPVPEATRARAEKLECPTQEHEDLAKQSGIDCKLEWSAYTDWLAANGRSHKDMAAGFRNWLRRAKPQTSNPSGKKQTQAERRHEWSTDLTKYLNKMTGAAPADPLDISSTAVHLADER